MSQLLYEVRHVCWRQARLFVGLFCLIALAGCRGNQGGNHADHVVAGEITVAGAYARAAIPGSPNSALYMTIGNGLDEAVTLVSVDTVAAGSAELHETARDDGGVTRMVPPSDGFEIAAGELLVLTPGEKHVMLIDLQADFASGSKIEVTLDFDGADAQTVSVPVLDPAAMQELLDKLDELDAFEMHKVDEALDSGTIEPEFAEQVQDFGAHFGAISWQAVGGSAEVMDAVSQLEVAWPQLLAELQVGDVAEAKPHAKTVHDVTHDLVEMVTSMQKLEDNTQHSH